MHECTHLMSIHNSMLIARPIDLLRFEDGGSELAELGWLLRQGRLHRDWEVLGLEVQGVPELDVVQALLHGVVPAVVQTGLGPDDCHWRLPGDLDAGLPGAGQAGLLVWEDLADHAKLVGLLNCEAAPSEGQLPDHGDVANDLRESLQGAHICSQTHVHLSNAEEAVGGTVSDVAGGGQVDATPDDAIVERANDRFAAQLDGGDASLSF
mmetsp:Transcript_42119/g.63624  ORF Transcript_42119/g.63624 Transcript_42119/m.63624 type:complete len:209 (+) Transcript_42119:332-958(+)